MDLKNDYGVGDVNFTTLMDTTDKTRIGLHAISLTNFDNTSAPEIAGGSAIEVNGALFFADVDESISGSPSDGNIYVKIVPDGATADAEFTNTAPVWDEEKQGWYSPTVGEENERYLNFIMVKAGASYTKYNYMGYNDLAEYFQNDVKVVGAIALNGDIYLEGDSYNINHSVFSKTATSSAGEVTGTAFFVKRPISGYCIPVVVTGSSDYRVTAKIQIYSNSDWRDFLVFTDLLSGSTQTITGNLLLNGSFATLNPGKYRLQVDRVSGTGATITLNLYIDSCYGIPESQTVVEADIWEDE